MKKLAKLKLQNLSVLDAKKMQALRGGSITSCNLRCDQNYQPSDPNFNSIPVSDCSWATIAPKCNYDLSKAVCVCTSF